MDRNNRIYNFGPDGRDACWAALSNSWSRCSNQQGSLNPRLVNSCRSTKKTSVLKASLSPRPQPLPSSSPRTLKRKSFKQLISANNQLSSSVEVMNQAISEPPTTNGQCNSSQSDYPELSSIVNSVMSNNNNNSDNDKNTQKLGELETIDIVNQKEQQLLCLADSGSSIDITEPTTVYAEKPVLVLQNEFGDHISSVSCPPTPSAANKQPIESAQQIEDENVSSVSSQLILSTAMKQPIESSQQIEGENVSSVSSQLILSTAKKQPVMKVQQIEDDNVSSMSCASTPCTTVEQKIESVQQIESENVLSISNLITPSITVEQTIESVQKIEGENVSSVSCSLTMSTATEQQIESVQKIESENVSSVSCPLTMSISTEQQNDSEQNIEGENVSSISCPLTKSVSIESEQQIESDQVISMSSLLSPCIAVEQPMTAKNSVMTEMAEGIVANHDKVSLVLSPHFPLMTSSAGVENLIAFKVVTSSLQPLHKEDDECHVQSNTEMMILSEKPTLSKYEMKIKEIDNKIISYSKSILCTVLVVVLLRVFF